MNRQTEVKLKKELERLKGLSKFGFEFEVVWWPDEGNPLSGEVVGKSIRVYEADENKAIETIQHEFLDLIVSNAVEPYKAIANSLVKLLNKEAYRRKEGAIEDLIRLLSAKTTTKEGERAG